MPERAGARRTLEIPGASHALSVSQPQATRACVRPRSTEQVGLTEKAPISGAFGEPSDGLEPSTPSLPCTFNRNQSPPTATVLACSCGFRAEPICH
jgi:hypothetical protein